jgi:hypothetical protein
MKAKVAIGIFSVLLLLATCQLVGPAPQAKTSAVPDPGAMTCASWLEIKEGDRVALAEQLAGVSGDVLERIRIRQHLPEGTPRDSLIHDVVTSVTKNCEVWPPRTRSVGEVIAALY